jgi:hypothetical protein
MYIYKRTSSSTNNPNNYDNNNHWNSNMDEYLDFKNENWPTTNNNEDLLYHDGSELDFYLDPRENELKDPSPEDVAREIIDAEDQNPGRGILKHWNEHSQHNM